MFESITDALTYATNQETFLAADAHVKHPYQLNQKIDINRDRSVEGKKTFIGVENQIKCYIFKNFKNIEHIHFCGGQPWNV